MMLPQHHHHALPTPAAAPSLTKSVPNEDLAQTAMCYMSVVLQFGNADELTDRLFSAGTAAALVTFG